MDLERFDGPGANPFAVDCRLAPRGLGEGTLSKSTVEVRITGREEDPTRFMLEGGAGWRELVKYDIGLLGLPVQGDSGMDQLNT